MGIREEIQAELAEAFDTDLADAVSHFAGTYMGPGEWDPISESSTAQPMNYNGRGVLAGYDSRRIDDLNIKAGDVRLVCLANEVSDRPQVGHQISAMDLITGETVTYRVVTADMDPAQAHYEIQLRRS